SLRLVLNGRIVPGTATFVDYGKGKEKDEVEWTFQLPEGEHELAVLARGPDSSSVSAPIKCKHTNPAKQPRLHVLTVGINKYKDGSLNLKYAVPDAKALAAAFVKNCKGQPFSDVISQKPLLDEEATAAKILAALDEMREGVQGQDLAIVFIACHGVKQ